MKLRQHSVVFLNYWLFHSLWASAGTPASWLTQWHLLLPVSREECAFEKELTPGEVLKISSWRRNWFDLSCSCCRRSIFGTGKGSSLFSLHRMVRVVMLCSMVKTQTQGQKDRRTIERVWSLRDQPVIFPRTWLISWQLPCWAHSGPLVWIAHHRRRPSEENNQTDTRVFKHWILVI